MNKAKLMGLVAVVCLSAIFSNRTRAEQIWAVGGGKTQAGLNLNELEALGVSVSVEGVVGSLVPDALQEWSLFDSTLTVSTDRGVILGYDGVIGHDATIVLESDDVAVRIEGVTLSISHTLDGSSFAITDASDSKQTLLTAVDSKIGFDRPGQALLIEVGNLIITQTLANQLAFPELEGVSLGAMMIQAGVFLVSGDEDNPEDGEGEVAGGNQGTICPTPVGPDVIVGGLIDIGNFNNVTTIDAFAVGTESCNIGNQNLLWIANNNQHPVIGQSMYRLKDGRFEHLGQSWLKHGFTALTLNLCGCGCSGQGGAVLGVGCSDPYGAGLNGSQPGLGPKFQVNPHTGFFVYPHDSSSGNSIYKRCQVKAPDLDPAQNAGAIYYVEGQYVAPDDSAAGNQDNNASHRRVTISGSGNNFNASMMGPTIRELPAIRAWKVHDPGVVETDIRVTNEGLMILAARATDLGNGFWHYEYALHNLNSDRSAGSFIVPVPNGAIIQNIGFHDVDYHSGEPFNLVDWPGIVGNGTVEWATTPYDQNPNANAIRWGTLYNFRFDTNLVPVTGDLTIGLFKPGGPATMTVTTVIPDPTAGDCNFNKLPDFCDVNCNGGNGGECNLPGCGLSDDCNSNGAPDECETNNDCNSNFNPDDCDIAGGSSDDCDTNGEPDECDPDFDGDENPDACDDDIDGDGVSNGADVCDLTPVGAPIHPDGVQVGDVNSDCDLNLGDYGHLSTCLQGSGPGDPASNGCQTLYDTNDDTIIDLHEIAYFQHYFTGPSEE